MTALNYGQALWAGLLIVATWPLEAGAQSAVTHSLRTEAVVKVAERLTETREYGKAVAVLRNSLKEAEDHQDDRSRDLVHGALGLTWTAAGETRKAVHEFEESGSKAEADGNLDIAARSFYNQAIVTPRILGASALSAKWFSALKGDGRQSVEKIAEQDITAPAESSATDATKIGNQRLAVRARVAEVEYGPTEISPSLALRYLDRAFKDAFQEHDGEGLLLIGNAAIGRFIQYRETSTSAAKPFSDFAVKCLNALLETEPPPEIKSRAIALLGRLYGLSGHLEEALALTGEASLIGIGPHDLTAELELFAQRAAILERLGRTGQALAEYKRATDEIELVRPVVKAQFDIARKHDLHGLMAQILSSRVELMLKLDGDGAKTLEDARNIMELQRLVDLEYFFSEPCISASGHQINRLSQLKPGIAVVYPVVFEKHTDVILYYGGVAKHYYYQIDRAEITKKIEDFRNALRDQNSTSYKSIANALYRILLEKPDSDLQGAGITTLIFAPDRDLRGVPFSALYDGKAFLVTRYAVATPLALSMVDPTPRGDQPIRGLVMGLTEARQGLPPLPNVEQEVNSVGSILTAAPKFNAELTNARVKGDVDDERPNFIHIATHGNFSRLAEENYVLTYDSKLTIQEFRDVIRPLRSAKGLDLLTLSACETAEGDDDSILGLAGAAYQAGAKAVFGSLWQVSDKSTSKLLPDFYRIYTAGIASKAEALRQAQMTILNEKGTEHPFYWAPFVIIGNWM